MTTIITTPSGKEIRIDGTKVCRSSSQEKCSKLPPGMVDELIRSARRKGWPVKMPTFRERFENLRAKHGTR